MTSTRILGSRWVKASFFLILAAYQAMHDHTSASYLSAAGCLCFAWTEAFRKYPPPVQLSSTIGGIYRGFRSSDYRPEPVTLVFGVLGLMLWIASLLTWWRALFN